MVSTLVLGIDGGTFRILDDLDLPTFDALAGDGVRGTLRSTYPPITFPAWKCLSTGKNPGKLGVFGFANFDRASKANERNSSSDFDGAELWDYLSDEGLRSVVVNVPTTYPPHDIEGVMVAGPNAGGSGYVAPADREPDVEATGYRTLTAGDRLAFKAGGDKAIEAARRVVGSRFDTADALLDSDDPDLLFLGIYCTDTLQHYYWGGREVEDVYELVDERLGELLERLESDDDEWNVVVVSDHGFRSIKGGLNLDTWLEREGFLARRGDSSEGTASSGLLTTETAYALIEVLRLERLVDVLPRRLVRAVADRLPSGSAVPVVDAVDWEQSDAVFVNGGIYLVGDDDGVRDELESALREAVDPDGDPLLAEIRRGGDVYEGPYVAAAPDLVPVSDHYKLLGFGHGDDVYALDDDWIAGHEMDGVFVASGPGFVEGDGVELDVYDVAPTLLHSMGLAVPDDVDGDVRTDVLDGDGDVTMRESLEPDRTARLSAADDRRIQERLEQLGYVE